VAIAHPFDYVRPATLDEVVTILHERGDDARLLAGGTDLIGWIAGEEARPELVVDLKGIEGLDSLAAHNGLLRVGALTTFTDILRSDLVRERLPLLWEMGRKVASRAIRNRATLVGNICSGVPCCDSGPVLLVCDAEVVLYGPGGEERMAACDWFRGPKETARGSDQVVTAVEIPLPAGKHGGCYVKLGRYRGEDLAQASVAILALPDREYRVAFGAVAPTPIRGEKIEAFLRGRSITPESIARARGLVEKEIRPITDIRASREYRMRMVRVMLERGLQAAAERFAGAGPEYGAGLI
jgi:CO/xanthine dehydrogenase FAD-binding subunit